MLVNINALNPKLEKIIPDIRPFLSGKYFQQFFNDWKYVKLPHRPNKPYEISII